MRLPTATELEELIEQVKDEYPAIESRDQLIGAARLTLLTARLYEKVLIGLPGGELLAEQINTYIQKEVEALIKS